MEVGMAVDAGQLDGKDGKLLVCSDSTCWKRNAENRQARSGDKTQRATILPLRIIAEENLQQLLLMAASCFYWSHLYHCIQGSSQLALQLSRWGCCSRPTVWQARTSCPWISFLLVGWWWWCHQTSVLTQQPGWINSTEERCIFMSVTCPFKGYILIYTVIFSRTIFTLSVWHIM